MRTALATAGAAALALTLGITACGGSPARPAAPSGILPTTAVAGLAVATQPLTSQDVQKDSNARDLAARLAGWGYVSGWQRTFQGESRRLTLVVSRSLQFRTSPGAAAFVAYMHQKVGSFYPFAVTSRLRMPGRSGWVIRPPLCGCHMATPLLAGVTAQGRKVSWLEINGPRASTRLLTQLLDDLFQGVSGRRRPASV
jgi:hypothetical protein